MALNHFFPHLWLASKSPRRQEILQMSGFSFEVKIQEVEENYPDTIDLEEVPSYLSRLKLTPFLNVPNQWILSCDTLVFLENQILSKPQNESEAIEMLSSLSEKTHQVISGFSLLYQGQIWSFSEKTEVSFRKLPMEWIQWYVSEYKPFDKAGAYGVQECIGMMGVEKIHGDFYNVMGLPVSRLSYEWNKILNK